MASKRTKNIIFGVLAALTAAVFISKAFETDSGTKAALEGPHVGAAIKGPTNTVAPTRPRSTDTYYPNTPDYIPPAGHPRMTRDEQIKALREEDPSSHGYTDADREFLREHGVTEAQARAMEDVAARQGVY